MQYNGHDAAQGHWMSPLPLPMERPCVTFYSWIVKGHLHQFPICRGLQSSFRCRRGVPLFNVLVRGWTPEFNDCKIWPQETRDIILWCSVKCISIYWTTGVTHGCNRQRDRRTDILIANAALRCVARPEELHLAYVLLIRKLSFYNQQDKVLLIKGCVLDVMNIERL